MDDCYYCEKGEKLRSLMIPVTTIGCADVYLFRDQTHRGKCIVVYNRGHVTEWYKIPGSGRHELIDTVALVAEALTNLFHADKINYATYGDIVNHLHVHVTPKYKNGPDWGGPFRDPASARKLTETEYNRMGEDIRKELDRLQK